MTIAARPLALPALAAVALIGVAAAVVAMASPPSAERRVVRGIATDHRVDLPLDPGRADAPKPRTPPAPVKITTTASGSLGTGEIAGRVAPIEVVAVGARADLVWDPPTGELFERDEVVARRMVREDLPAAADRVALVRRVRELVQAAPRSIRLMPEERVARAGARLELQIPGVAGRSVVVVVVSGDGLVGLVHPARGEASAAAGDVTVGLDVGEPFGQDQIVVVTSAKSLDGLAASLRRLDRRRAAGEVLGFLDALDPTTIDVGTQSVVTRP